MGTDISPGIVLHDGTLVHDADFNTLVSEAVILATAISSKTLKSEMSLGDELLINDAGNLKKVTGQQIVSISAVPAGCMMDYAGAAEPLGWMFCYGQAISRTTYAALFAAIGTAYGDGGGDTTLFNVPDCRARATVGKDDMGGTAANLITSAVSGFDAKVLGNKGGSQSHTLVAAETPVEVPAHTHTVPAHAHTGASPDHLHAMNHTHTYNEVRSGIPTGLPVQSGSGGLYVVFGQTTGGPSPGTTAAADRSLAFTTSTQAATATTPSTAISTGGGPHRNLQPTIILNKIIKT